MLDKFSDIPHITGELIVVISHKHTIGFFSDTEPLRCARLVKFITSVIGLRLCSKLSIVLALLVLARIWFYQLVNNNVSLEVPLCFTQLSDNFCVLFIRQGRF